MKLRMIVKQVNVKTLVSGDKAGRLILDTVYPDDVKQLMQLSDKIEVEVNINGETATD